MIRTLLATLLLTALPTAAMAQEDSNAIEDASYRRASEVQYVLLGTVPATDVFAPSFLSAVPESQLQTIVEQLVVQNGKLLSVDELKYRGDGAISFDLVFEQARAAAILQLSDEAPYQATGFRITGVRRIDDAPQKILADFIALPGSKGFGIYILGEGGPQPVLSNRPTAELAIGSTFKLYVLSALGREIKAGRRHWDDVVKLDAHSVPSGQMQDWPIGTPVTLQTLATMMISISDNTATDVLMRTLGRDALAAEVTASGHSDPSKMLPMLKTVELFALKSGDPARILAYTAADDAGQAKLLDQWAQTADGVSTRPGPVAIDSIEWFASPQDIANIYSRLRDLGDPVVMDILKVDALTPGNENDYWDYLGYKGGSETGVINLSWLLKDKADRWFVVSASWNDPAKPVDDAAFAALAARMLAMLHQ
jgi:hypothetical protein